MHNVWLHHSKFIIIMPCQTGWVLLNNLYVLFRRRALLRGRLRIYFLFLFPLSARLRLILIYENFLPTILLLNNILLLALYQVEYILRLPIIKKTVNQVYE